MESAGQGQKRCRVAFASEFSTAFIGSDLRSNFILEGYSVGVVLCFIGFGPPLQSLSGIEFMLAFSDERLKQTVSSTPRLEPRHPPPRRAGRARADAGALEQVVIAEKSYFALNGAIDRCGIRP